MGKARVAIVMLAAVAALAISGIASTAASASERGFDQYGYNDTARIFVGTCRSWGEGKYGWTQAQAEAYCGASSNDQLVMKWNKAWDECNENGYENPEYCAGAMLTNEWNGQVPGGSGETFHYKIVWVGSAGEGSSYWRAGGELVWGNYEVLMAQGTNSEGVHEFLVHATPNGFGAGR